MAQICDRLLLKKMGMEEEYDNEGGKVNEMEEEDEDGEVEKSTKVKATWKKMTWKLEKSHLQYLLVPTS
ncbi:hypothetical protein Tco_1215949 [Tanacetum coccineum]